jgi:hypothetical protein
VAQDPTILIESAIAQKLGELDARVNLFADEFRKSGLAQQSVSVLVGHSSSEFQWATTQPEPVGFELATFEIRCEIADIKNHSKGLGYLTSAMDLLRGFEPYTSIRPIVPIRYAPQGYSTSGGTWTYTGTVQAAIMRPASEYELIEELPEVTSVQLGLWREGFLQRQIDINLEAA